MRRSLLRIAVTGIGCALLVFAGGHLLRRALLGADDDQARARVRSEVGGAFASMTGELRAITGQAGNADDLRKAGLGDVAAADRLFEAAAAAARANEVLDVALTFYATDGRPLAWAGRPTELLPERLQEPEAWFIAPVGFGLRLMYVATVTDLGMRVGSVAVERPVPVLTRGRTGSRPGRPCDARDRFCFPTRVGPVAIELPFENPRTIVDDDSFEVKAPSGTPLLIATVSPVDLALTRDRWRRAIQSFALMTFAATLLLMVGPLLDLRNRAMRAPRYLGAALGAAVLVVGARGVLMGASPADWTDSRLFSGATYASFVLPSNLPDRLLTSPSDFLLTALAAAALVVLALFALEGWRIRTAHRRLNVDSGARIAGFLATQFAAGSVVAVTLLVHAALVRDTIAKTTLDLVHFSMQPWDTSRTALQIGLIVAHATVAIVCVLVLRAAMVRWRVPRRDWRMRMVTLTCWLAPLVLWQARLGETIEQQSPLLAAAAGTIAAALMATRLKARYRHGSQAFRLTLLALGLIVPAFAFYPTIFQSAGAAKALLVETRYADEALTQRERLKTQLFQTLDEIDRIQNLALLTSRRESPGGTEDSTVRALEVWQDTALALYDITSSIELYDPDGKLVSRFAFNLPEDLTDTPPSEEESCTWGQPYGLVAPFFAEERPVLHAGRNICSDGDTGARMGSIVVHAMLDYENLPFIASRTPYRELLRPPDSQRPADGFARTSDSSFYGWSGRDVEFVFYGWSGRPLYPSSEPAWQLDEAVLDRVMASRSPFWRQLRRNGVLYNVYLQNDRAGVYALGFPVVTPLGHLVNLAELTVLATGTYLLLLIANALFAWLGRRTGTAPALLREIRASFYRKLFLAFVAAVILPVAALAVVTRNYVVDEMQATVEQDAVRTVSEARRVVEDLVTQFDVGLDDNLMVWASRLIDQDVNVFDGPSLAATSERNLFASGSLPTRTPADVFRTLQLRNDAATVTRERVGALQEYLVAATPLTGRQPGAMLTVPLTSRQQEIESRIATLNRHMLLGALLFILAGAGLGYSMAERISDPVNRLSRATRRISRGDLDARIIARSSDELRRLVDDFNGMARELQRQHKELERTHRVEAWAEMARQVAHEIKNPLTPIQLTAEHLRRVHIDRGEPLGPVVQECVGAILTQVRLLRQIASEFSSFASSPIARPTVVSTFELLQEIVGPYRIGLQERIVFSVDVPSSLPPIHVDRTLVTRSLTNIVENALHAMPGNGTLTVVASSDARVVRISVSDTGAGMDAEALTRAFEPYFSTKATGTGLGLPIAKRNIELNGGTIDVASERGRGTTVEITLPVAQP